MFALGPQEATEDEVFGALDGEYVFVIKRLGVVGLFAMEYQWWVSVEVSGKSGR